MKDFLFNMGVYALWAIGFLVWVGLIIFTIATFSLGYWPLGIVFGVCAILVFSAFMAATR